MRRLDAFCVRASSLTAYYCLCAAITLALIGPCSSTYAAISIWDGGGSDNNWTTGANWLGFMTPGAPPPNNGTADIVFPALGTVETPLVDVPYHILSMSFGSGNGRYVVLAAAELTIGAGGITNNDADTQFIFGPVKLSAHHSWTAAAGPLEMDVVNLNGRIVTLAGAHPINMTSVISGAGSLTVADSYTSTATMSGGVSNSYSGFTNVDGGTLTLQKTGGAVAIPGDVFITDSATVLLAANEQISHAANQTVYVNPGGLLDVNTRTETLARLQINGGAVTTTGAGKLVAAEAIVTGNTASWSNSNNLYVGDSANGTLDILFGGDVTCGVCYIGNQNGATGTVEIDGAGSTFNAGSGFHVGYNGIGLVRVINGGQLTTAGTLTGSRIGSLPGSTGEITVDGMGSVWNLINNTFLSIGEEGDGTLNVTNHGQVNSLGSSIGNLSTATGAAIVDDAVWTIAGQLFVGSAGEGNLSITGGGQVVLDVFDRHAFLAYQSDSIGTVIVDGAGSTLSLTSNVGMQDLYVGHAGEAALTITNGGEVTNRSAFVGYDPTALGTVTVDGAGTTWNNADNLLIGDQGDGTLHISGGATVNNLIALVGNENTGSGTVTVDGAGSTWNSIDREVVVGNFGTGSVSITNGGHVQSSAGIVGAEEGSHGAVTVDGPDSIWENSGDFSVDSGSLEITNGGRVTSTGGNIGTLAVGTGTVTVDGAGSTWTNSSDLHVGIFDVGILIVTGGGQVTSDNGFVGFNAGSSGGVTIDGAGSRWTNAGEVSIGFNGDGVLTVSNGGTLEAANVYVGVNGQGELRGDGLVIGNVQNDGLVSPGTSPGPLGIDGNYTQTADGTLRIELASVASFDQLIAAGAALLAGTLEVALLDGFAASGEHSFTILTAAAVNGEFDVELLPSVPNLTFDLIYNPTSVVLHVVAPTLDGDFNGDGAVNAADYVAWRKTGGTPAGYNTWRTHFGETVGAGVGSATSANIAVPEPASLMLCVAALLIALRAPCART